MSAVTNVSLDRIRDLLAETKERTGHAHFPKLAAVPSIGQYQINVTNTGTVDADEVVLGFIAPPGAGRNGLPLKKLFGFERVRVKAGETVSVFLYPSLTSLTAPDALTGELRPLVGEHRVTFGVEEAADRSAQGHTGFAVAPALKLMAH